MSTDTTEEKSSSKKTVEAVGNKTIKAATGDVLTFQVKSTTRPNFETSDECPRLYTTRTPAGYWAASWVPTSAGEHTVTVGTEDSDPVVFSITATDKEN